MYNDLEYQTRRDADIIKEYTKLKKDPKRLNRAEECLKNDINDLKGAVKNCKNVRAGNNSRLELPDVFKNYR